MIMETYSVSIWENAFVEIAVIVSSVAIIIDLYSITNINPCIQSQ